VMTVHGAKGLEAPVVILPDCGGFRSGGGGANLVQDGAGNVFWPPARAGAAGPVRVAMEAADARAAAERNRLLYVAMTRAESWLIVGAAGDIPADRMTTWYGAIEAGLISLGAEPLELHELKATGLRLQRGDFPLAGQATVPEAREARGVTLPRWATRSAPPAPRDVVARTPSDLGGEKVMTAAATDPPRGDALQHGRLVHLMLEHLPRMTPPGWRDAAADIAMLEAPDLDQQTIAAAFAEAERVLTAPDLAGIFSPDAFAEVTVTGQSALLGAPVLGAIDRLIVEHDRVAAIDFKTNAEVPEHPADVPEGLLRQMGAYAEMLAAIYPERTVETAILWTRAARLMALPHDLVIAALRRASAS